MIQIIFKEKTNCHHHDTCKGPEVFNDVNNDTFDSPHMKEVKKYANELKIKKVWKQVKDGDQGL